MGRFGKRVCHLVFLDQVGKHRHVRRSLGSNPTISSEMSWDRVDELGALPHEQVTISEHQPRRLLLFALHGHEPHARPLRCFADRLSIDRVALLSLHERSYISGRDQPNLVTKLSELAGPVMRPTTCLQRYRATLLGCEEIQQLSSADLLAGYRLTALSRAVNVKDMLRNIQTDHDNL